MYCTMMTQYFLSPPPSLFSFSLLPSLSLSLSLPTQGEYIAPEKVENIYCRSPLIAQAYLHGDSLQSTCVAIVVPDEEELMAWAKKNNVAGTFGELCNNEVTAALPLLFIVAYFISHLRQCCCGYQQPTMVVQCLSMSSQ